MDIPQGIKFGSKVVIIPYYVEGFERGGYMVSLMKGKKYHWVKRGEPIGTFNIHGSTTDNFLFRLFSSETHSASILSPVSGLILHPTFRCEIHPEKNWNSIKPAIAQFSLLLPDDEPKPESGEYIYRDMCKLVRNMSHYSYTKKTIDNRATLTYQELNDLIRTQLKLNPLIFDAIPQWSDYLDEARTMYPEIRPHIRHLADFDKC